MPSIAALLFNSNNIDLVAHDNIALLSIEVSLHIQQLAAYHGWSGIIAYLILIFEHLSHFALHWPPLCVSLLRYVYIILLLFFRDNLSILFVYTLFVNLCSSPSSVSLFPSLFAIRRYPRRIATKQSKSKHIIQFT